MALNPYSRRPAERVAQTKTFEDAGETFTLTFKKPGQVDKCAALDTANELISRYLGTDTAPGVGWPPVGGKVVRITPTAVHNAALYAEMQPADAIEHYTAEEFVAFQVVLEDETWERVSAFASGVMRGADPSLSGARDTETPSESVSGTQSDTPN